MKNIFKKIIYIVLSASLFIFSTGIVSASAQAEDLAVVPADTIKQEVVYANLAATGEVNDIYVVNILNIQKAGTVVDYGVYSSIKNLTSTQSLSYADGQISADLPTGNFYYQGTLDGADLPWNVVISYYLDGQKLTPMDLAGRSGHLQIALSTTANKKLNSCFFDNYLLQISIYLDADKCSNIMAAGATLANAGKNKLLSYTVMPGENANISLSADVQDFSMQGIDIAAVPFSMQIEVPDTTSLTGDMTLLTDAIGDLHEGVGELKYGAWLLKDGAAAIKSGSTGFNSGIGDLNAGSASLVSGSSQIKDGLSAISTSLSGSSGSFSIGSLVTLPSTLRSLALGLDAVSIGLTDLKNAFVPAYSALDAAMSAIPSYTISTADLAPLYADSPANATLIDHLYETYTAAVAAKTTYNTVKPAFAAVESSLNTMSGTIGTISGSLTTMADGIDTALASGGIDAAISALSSGISTLLTNYTSFHQGLVSYTGGVSELATAFGSMNTGIAGISDGASGLYSGVRELYGGTEELNTAVADMPEQIELQIDEWINGYDKSDFEPVSFASPRNNAELVQFVLKTEKIEKTPDPALPEPEEKENFWTRFLNLFRA